MKTMKAIAGGIIMITMFALVINTANAQATGQGRVNKQVQPQEELLPPSPPPPPPPPDVKREQEHPKLELPDMTDAQRESIKKADLKNMQVMTPLKNQMREKKARLASILATGPFDQNAADQVADDIGKLASSLLKAQIRHDQELRGILTPDQQIIFDAKPKPFLDKIPGK
jgi:Spy/CpxP family protein refolding chaperone